MNRKDTIRNGILFFSWVIIFFGLALCVALEKITSLPFWTFIIGTVILICMKDTIE